MSDGWVSIHRKLQDNDLWKSEPFTRGQAWVDLILLANHEQGFFYKRGNKVVVKRGQVGYSQKGLADRWKWSRTKVRKFLSDLEEEQQIKQHKSHITTLITLINYDEYQSKKQQKNNRKTTEKQQKNTNNNDNNVNKYNYGDPEKLKKDQPINHVSFVEAFNELYDRELRVTDKKREMIRGRLRTFTGAEIKQAWENRMNDDWLNSEGRKHLDSWKAAMRNDEKIERYLLGTETETISKPTVV